MIDFMTFHFINSKRQSRTKKIKRLDMVQGFVIKHRTASLHLSSKRPPAEKILQVPIQKVLPVEEDVELLEEEFEVAIDEYISDLFDFLPSFVEPPAGLYADEAKKKSEMVS